MPNKNKKKGDALERAVRLIRKTILESDPKFAGVKFSIEVNQIFRIKGVRHEVDVLVRTYPGSEIEALWIYECKNWKKPIGKNAIIVLSEKIDALNATRGFLVAKEFTKDATAQAEADQRIQLIPYSEEFINPLDVQLLYNKIEPSSIVINIKERNAPPSPRPIVLDYDAVTCLVNGKKRDFYSFVTDYLDAIVEELKKEPKFYNEGEFCEPKGIVENFSNGELVVNSMDVERLVIYSHFWFSTQRKKIISKFELKDQGRVYSLEPIEDAGRGEKI